MASSRGRGLLSGPRPGETLTGMVKSYNRKGFGFIMCQALDADVYFSRESLAPQLQTSDLAGEYVTFEVHRFPDGKLQARNLRAVGETGITRGPDGFGGVPGKGKGRGTPMLGGREEEDRSRDWYCEGCSERNFVKRFECFKCKAARPRSADTGERSREREREREREPVVFVPPPPTRRGLSPHAGSRAMREGFRKGGGKGGGGGNSRSGSRPRRTRRSPSNRRRRSRSNRHRGTPRECSRGRGQRSSESSSSGGKSSRRKKRRKRSRSDRSSSSSGDSSSAKGRAAAANKAADGTGSSSATAGQEGAATTSTPANPETEKAKAEVLEKLLKLREVEPREARIRDWRALLREWHPDKNPDRVEVATAVFQFLQKGKLLIDTESK